MVADHFSSGIRSIVLLLLLSLGLSADLFGATVQTVGPAVSPGAGIPECPELSLFMAQDDWLERLVNPVYTTIEEVDRAAEERRRMLECLDSVGRRALLSDQIRMVRYHLALFLSFADAGTDSSPELVDLSTTRDPAVRRLREDLGLVPPRGVILVRYFTDPEQMPDHVRGAFENPQTQAVTLWCRYVAVLTSTRRNLGQTPTATDGLASTFSHELVHVMLWLRCPSARELPVWLDEGLATYLELAPDERGRLATGTVRKDLLETLSAAEKEGTTYPIRTLLGATRRGFVGENARAHYAQAWALASFIMNGRSRTTKLRKYLDAVNSPRTPTPIATFQSIYAKDLEKFDAAWRRHIEKLSD